MLERLKSPQDFSVVYNQGKPHFGRYVVISVLPSNRSVTRVGFAVGKKVGNAVARNKVKRRLRAVVRSQSSQIPPGLDLIIGAKRNSVTASFQDLAEDVSRVFKYSGVSTAGRNKSTRVGEEHA